MPARKVLRRPRRKIAAGDFRTPVQVLQSSTAGTIDGGIERTLTPLLVLFTKEETVSPGVHLFDRVNIAVSANRVETGTHRFTARYRADVSAENILERGGTRFEILQAENLEGRNEYLVMRCRELGADDREATKA